MPICPAHEIHPVFCSTFCGNLNRRYRPSPLLSQLVFAEPDAGAASVGVDEFDADGITLVRSNLPTSLRAGRDGLEDTEDYRGFEAAIISDYDAETAVERELVLRLASLLWRLRRIISIETDLFQTQAEILRDRRDGPGPACNEFQVHASDDTTRDAPTQLNAIPFSTSARELTCCFLRLGNLDNGAFERLGRCNAALWKQTAQTLFLLQTICRR